MPGLDLPPRVDAILNQRRPYAVPTVDEVIEEARQRFAGSIATRVDAVAYFHLHDGWTADDLKRAFKQKIFDVHPDRGGSEEEARRCVAMYEALE